MTLRDFTGRLYPGRWDALRPVTPQGLKATTVLAKDLTECVAKVSMGMPIDDDEDYALPIWAGVLPVQTRVLAPESDPRNLRGLTPLDYSTRVSPVGHRSDLTSRGASARLPAIRSLLPRRRRGGSDIGGLRWHERP